MGSSAGMDDAAAGEIDDESEQEILSNDPSMIREACMFLSGCVSPTGKRILALREASMQRGIEGITAEAR